MLKFILVANVILALILRVIHGGRMEFVLGPLDADSNELVNNYRIAGINSQPSTAFRYVKMPSGRSIDLRYSPLGFSSKRAGWQLTRFAETHYAGTINIFAVSIGAQTMLNVNDSLYRRSSTVAINPCLGRDSLKPAQRILVPIGAALLEIIALPLGCLALLPIIPAEEGEYSIVLWADLLCNIAFCTAKQDHPTIAIQSLQDEFLDEDYFNGKFQDSIVEVVDTEHARIGDPMEAPKYQEAIRKAMKYHH